MANEDENELKLFELDVALECFGDDQEILLMQLKSGIKTFDKGGPLDKLVSQYKRFDWHIVGSQELKEFETSAHSLKGRAKYMALTQLGYRLEKLQYAIRDGHFISVGMLLEKVLQSARPSHQALLEQLKEPIDNLFSYEVNEQFEFYSKIYKHQVKQESKVHVHPKLEESCKLARFLAMKRDPGLKCDWNEDPQQDDNQIKCNIF